jgi:nucleoside phosphorylase
LPEIGTNSAATLVTQLLNDFPSVRFGLLVGIGGGVPDLANEIDIRLDDIVVSKYTETAGGVVQYDMGNETLSGFKRTGPLNKPPPVLRAAVQRLRAQHELEDSHVPLYLSKMLEKFTLTKEKYTYPGTEHDRLFTTAYEHQGGETCASCDYSQVIRRPPRSSLSPFIHYGTIGSVNRVIKHAVQREKLKSDEPDIICVEMEAAGLMDSFPCLVIRGICDYADSHKNKKWQPHAAATAAAYMKQILSVIPAQEVIKIPHATSVVQIPPESSLPAKSLKSASSYIIHQFTRYRLIALITLIVISAIDWMFVTSYTHNGPSRFPKSDLMNEISSEQQLEISKALSGSQRDIIFNFTDIFELALRVVFYGCSFYSELGRCD